MMHVIRKLEQFEAEHYTAAVTLASLAYVASLVGGLLVVLS